MGIISRFTDIMSANINAVLQDAENKNADKLLEKYLRDAQDDLMQVKSETAAVMAEETAAKREVDTCKEQMAKYEKYAADAVLAGNDGDALKFLEAKQELTSKLADLENRLTLCTENAKRMREMLTKLGSDIETAQAKLKELKAKLSVAQSTEKINQLNEKMAGSSLGGFDSMAEQLQKRIDAADARAALNQSNGDSEMEDLIDKYKDPQQQAKTKAQAELEAIKAKLGM